MIDNFIEYSPIGSPTDDLSEFELQEFADDVIRELQAEAILRLTPVNSAERDAQSDPPNVPPPDWPNSF